jgi:hypothetical protein
MSSKRKIRRHECTRKKRYEREDHAKFEARKARIRSAFDIIVAYKCPHCSGWHIGHKGPGKTRQ